MRRLRITRLFVFSVAIFVVTLIIPVLMNSGSFDSLCRINRAQAQDNPCLVQEATISAQELQLLRLELTGTAMREEIGLLESREPQRILATFIVIISPTPDRPLPTNTPRVSATPLSSLRPTLEILPTIIGSQIEIVEIVAPGDLTSEGVRIRNLGNSINLTGWTLNDTEGNTYTFPELFLFSNAEITVFTRSGQNTPIALYWGSDEALWGESGDVVTLKDADGSVQAVLRVP